MIYSVISLLLLLGIFNVTYCTVAEGDRNRNGGAEENRIKSENSINHRTEIRLRPLASKKETLFQIQ